MTKYPLFRILKPESFWNPSLKDDDTRYEVIAEAGAPYSEAEIEKLVETHGPGLLQEETCEYL